MSGGSPHTYQWLLDILHQIEYFGTTELERNWVSDPAFIQKFYDNMWVPVVIVAAYLAMVWKFNKPAPKPSATPAVRKPGYKPTKRYGEALWNLFLTVFSVWGAIHVVPRLLGDIIRTSFIESFCIAPSSAINYSFRSGPCGFWIFVFCLSKIPELFDTVLLLAKGRHVIFLHWYHHASVLLYCWHAFATTAPAGVWFGSMNLIVHSLMYYYYMLTALGHRPKWDFILTTMQIMQMVVGVFITLYTFLSECKDVGKENLHFAMVMSVTALAPRGHSRTRSCPRI